MLTSASIRKKILIPMVLLAIFVTLAIFISNMFQFQNFIDEKIDLDLDRAVNEMTNELDSMKMRSSIASLYFANDQELKKIMKNNQIEQLYIRAHYLEYQTQMDFFYITDESGVIITSSHSLDNYTGDASQLNSVKHALNGRFMTGIEHGLSNCLLISSSAPLYDDNNQLLGVVVLGFRLDTNDFVDRLKAISGCEFTVFMDNYRVATTLIDEDGIRLIDTKAPDYISEMILLDGTVSGQYNVLNHTVLARYIPLKDISGDIIGMLFAGYFITYKNSIYQSIILNGIIWISVLLIISTIFIIFTSMRIVAPIKDLIERSEYDLLKETQEAYKHQEKLTKALNEIATMFLSGHESSFKNTINSGSQMIAGLLNLDGLSVWRNFVDLDGLHASQIYNWDISKDRHTELVAEFNDLTYNESAPHWLETLSKGNVINGPVSWMAEPEASLLRPFNIASIFITPIFIDNSFWGAVFFSDDRNERTFDDDSIDMMRSAAFLFSNAIIKAEMANELADTNEYNNVLLHSAPIGVSVFDENGTIIDSNDAILKILGVNKEFYVSDFYSTFPEYQNDGRKSEIIVKERMEKAINGEVQVYECERLNSSGDIVPFEATYVGVKLHKKRYCLSYMYDLRHIKEAQEALRYHQKLTEALNKTAITFISKQEKTFGDMMSAGVEPIITAIKLDRLSVWKNVVMPDGLHASMIYRWDRELGGTTPPTEFFRDVRYKDIAPTWEEILASGLTINGPTSSMPKYEATTLLKFGVISAFITPIFIDHVFWGFVLYEDRHDSRTFDINCAEIMRAAAFLLTNTILNNEMERNVAEAERRIRLMLDSSPLSCNIWDKDLNIIDCNEEAVNLYGFRSKKEFKEGFLSLFPASTTGNNGSPLLSIDDIRTNVDKAFNEGHLKLECELPIVGGNFIPVEITLDRVRYDNDYVVIAYAHDLRDIKDAEKHIKLMLDSSPLSSQIWNRELKIIDCNEAAVKLYGFKDKQEYIDRFMTDCSPEFQPDGKCSAKIVPDQIKKALKEGYSTFEWIHQKPDGTEIPADITLVRVEYKDDYIIIGYTRDLREAKAAEAKVLESIEKQLELEVQKQTAQAANNAKTQFLANMSHEIRTPMNAILGMSELLIAENLNIRQHRYVEDIRTSSNALLSIINDILDISKIQASKFELVPVHYNFVEFIENITAMFKPLMKDKKLSYMVNVSEDTPKFLYGDDVRLRQILLNLLGNALKYTKEGAVTMTIWVDGTMMWASIADTGVGIASEELVTLFDAFEQADLRRNRYQQGTGLGLAIAKSLVEMMDGHISVESSYGKGTTFLFNIPYTLGDENLIRIEDDVTKIVYAPDAYVLAVDDRKTNLSVISGLLQQCHINVDTALSGELAIEMIMKNDYDLIFMDQMMPDMDGIETTHALRGMGIKLPIIALTANTVTGAKEQLIAAGMDDFLAKPIEKNNLYNILGTWLPAKKITDKPSDIDELEELGMNNDQKFWDKIYQIRGLSAKSGLETASGLKNNYRDTLEILMREIEKTKKLLNTYLVAKDMKKFGIEVHGIKGSLSLVGATNLSIKARNLETAAQKSDIDYCMKYTSDFLTDLVYFGDELKKAFADLENKKASIRIPSDLIPILNRISKAMGSMDFDVIFTEIDNLNAMKFSGVLKEEIESLISAVQVMNYDFANTIIKRLTK